MTRVVRNAALLCVAGILLASAAVAGTPDPTTSVIPLQGGRVLTTSGYQDNIAYPNSLPDSCNGNINCGQFPSPGAGQIQIKDFSGAVVPNATVVVDFSGCTDVQLNADQFFQVNQQKGPFNQIPLCPTAVQATANASGLVQFRLAGAGKCGNCSTTDPGPRLADPGCVRIFANGQLLKNAYVANFDVNGSGSCNAVDVSAVQTAVLTPPPAGLTKLARYDMTGDGIVNSSDVSKIATESLQTNGAARGCNKTTPYCP